MNEIEIAKAVANGNDGNLIGGVVVIILIAIPLIIKILSWSRETNANGALYAQLLRNNVQKRGLAGAVAAV